VRAPGEAITIDVKAVAGSADWLVGNLPTEPRERHFIILITYNGMFGDVGTVPDVWVMPHAELLALIKTARAPSTLRFVSRADVRKLAGRAHAWRLLMTDSSDERSKP
jgi:hypothetical protein